MDITEKWTTSDKIGSVTEKNSYTIGDDIYNVDNHLVLIDASDYEREVAKNIAVKYGKTVELVPRVNFPKGIQTPDYLIDGDRYDLKSPTGKGKDLLRDMIKKKKKQSPSFIFDVTNCPLSMAEIDKQVKSIYAFRQTRFVEKIVIYKDDEVKKVYSRQ